MIAVGRTGPFRSFENRKTLATAYTAYSKDNNGYAHGLPMLSYRGFEEAFDGWTTLMVAQVRLAGHLSLDVYVRKGDGQTVGFSSVTGSTLIGAREDLVSAEFTLDTPYYVIKKLLCEDGDDYRDCSKRFEIGLYDIHSGRKLSRKYAIKPAGTLIDTQTYEVLPR